jgi:HTH-type transcriptional regulator / antitoxin HigA
MSESTYPDVEPDYVAPPGEFLAEEIEARDMTQKALAAAMGRSPKVVNEIIRGKKAITAETALQLEDVLGLPASLWLRLEVAYQLSLARLRRASA